ncbi:MAG: hypothetical protein WCI73_07780 [Phycisphaerae bacterium]
MTLRDNVEYSNTKTKLGELQARYERLQNEPGGEGRARRLTLLSLKRLINQLTEEIAVYQAHHLTAR